MPDQSAFSQLINAGYTFKGESFRIGTAMLNGEVVSDTPISLPLKTMNRHGLIAGATGTGKTKTLQLIAEGLSNASVPVLVMDIKAISAELLLPAQTTTRSKSAYRKWRSIGSPPLSP